jgi:hypothetical protein
MYFGHFNNLKYDFSFDNSSLVDKVQDLMTRVNMKITESEKRIMCNDYHVKSGERPETIAFNMYKNPELHWTILYINGIVNPYSEWYMDELSFEQYVRSKYAEEDLYKVHHWETNPHGFIVDAPKSLTISELGVNVASMINVNTALYNKLKLEYGVTSSNQLTVIPVSNYEHETDLNENKRFIKLIKPEYIGDFVARFKSELIK